MSLIGILAAILSSNVISSTITFFVTSKSQKIDLSQKTINFWEGKADKYLERMAVLEQRVSALEKLKCEKFNCENRI